MPTMQIEPHRNGTNTDGRGLGRILVLEDEDTIRGALASRLGDLGFVAHTGRVDEEGLATARGGSIDTVVVAVDTFGPDQLALIDAVRAHGAAPEIIFLATVAPIATIVQAMKRGVFDFMQRPCRIREVEGAIRQSVTQRRRREKPRLALALDQLAAESNLTRREHDIVHALLCGLSNKDIAASLDITEHTVKTHLKNIFMKLRAKSRTEILSRVFVLLDAEE